MSFYLNDIYTLILISYAFFLCIVSLFDKNRLKLLTQYLFNQKYSLKYHKNDSFGFKFFTYTHNLLIISILISFYIYNSNKTMHIEIFLKICTVLSIWFFFKLQIVSLLGKLFEAQNYVQKYCYEHFSMLFFFSLTCFPFVLIISYGMNGVLLDNLSIYLFYFFTTVYLLLKIIVFKRLNVFIIKHIFYNILYFCCLEILPYLSLFKLLGILT